VLKVGASKKGFASVDEGEEEEEEEADDVAFTVLSAAVE
jgi:hypothetical protein